MLARKRLLTLALLLTLIALVGVGIAAAGGRPLVADLSSGTGASGTAAITLNQGQGEVCFDITITSPLIGTFTVDHIHRGVAGTNGGVVVSLQSQLSGCVSANADIIKEIRQNPAGFYVNVHSTAFPGGEIRGQLEKPED